MTEPQRDQTDCSLSSFFSFRLVSLVSSFAKEETREMRQKNPTASDIKKAPSGRELSRGCVTEGERVEVKFE